MEVIYIYIKEDSNETSWVSAILNKSWKQRTTKHKLYDHLHIISQTIQIREAKHAGSCRWSKDELISDIF